MSTGGQIGALQVTQAAQQAVLHLLPCLHAPCSLKERVCLFQHRGIPLGPIAAIHHVRRPVRALDEP
jgi:hypothetical protein